MSKITHIVLDNDSAIELIDDFQEEFSVEYEELGRKPNKYDIQEYFNVPILIQKLKNGEKYNLLTKV